jgi:hypothetical protein
MVTPAVSRFQGSSTPRSLRHPAPLHHPGTSSLQTRYPYYGSPFHSSNPSPSLKIYFPVNFLTIPNTLIGLRSLSGCCPLQSPGTVRCVFEISVLKGSVSSYFSYSAQSTPPMAIGFSKNGSFTFLFVL